MTNGQKIFCALCLLLALAGWGFGYLVLEHATERPAATRFFLRRFFRSDPPPVIEESIESTLPPAREPFIVRSGPHGERVLAHNEGW